MAIETVCDAAGAVQAIVAGDCYVCGAPLLVSPGYTVEAFTGECIMCLCGQPTQEVRIVRRRRRRWRRLLARLRLRHRIGRYWDAVEAPAEDDEREL